MKDTEVKEKKRKKSDKEKFGEWFFKRQKRETDKLLKYIDLDIKDIKIIPNPHDR